MKITAVRDLLLWVTASGPAEMEREMKWRKLFITGRTVFVERKKRKNERKRERERERERENIQVRNVIARS